MDKEYKIWTKKDGTKIAVTDMADLHIENTIELLQQRLSELPREHDVYAVDNKRSDVMDMSIIRDDIQCWIEVFGGELIRRSRHNGED